jgi:hypothetical protein
METNEELKDLLKQTLPHLEYKRTHTQTTPAMKAVARLMEQIREALK